MPTKPRGPYCINDIVYERYDAELLELVQALHMATTGSSDLNPDRIAFCRGFIQVRLDDWLNSCLQDASYDELVRRLCRLVLEQYSIRYPEDPRPTVEILDRPAARVPT
jgi:hypothetical protein